MKKNRKAIESRQGTINNQKWYSITLTRGELLQFLDQTPNHLLEKMLSDAGPNFDLSIINLDDISPELKETLDGAGLLEDQDGNNK